MDAYLHHRSEMIRFYKSQLKKFDTLGMGSFTANNIEITPRLVEATKRRLNRLILKNISL